VAKSSQPVFRVVADARSDIGELALQPGLEGRDPVIGEQAQEAEDLRRRVVGWWSGSGRPG
jgi:hypothetical protein